MCGPGVWVMGGVVLIQHVKIHRMPTLHSLFIVIVAEAHAHYNSIAVVLVLSLGISMWTAYLWLAMGALLLNQLLLLTWLPLKNPFSFTL